MKLILDQGLPRSAAIILTDMGHEASHVGDISLAFATDMEILNYAASKSAVVVTLDADFHSLLAASGAKNPSVIRIREEGLRGAAVADCVGIVIQRCADELMFGAVVSVIPPYIRIKLLPLK